MSRAAPLFNVSADYIYAPGNDVLFVNVPVIHCGPRNDHLRRIRGNPSTGTGGRAPTDKNDKIRIEPVPHDGYPKVFKPFLEFLPYLPAVNPGITATAELDTHDHEPITRDPLRLALGEEISVLRATAPRLHCTVFPLPLTMECIL